MNDYCVEEFLTCGGDGQVLEAGDTRRLVQRARVDVGDRGGAVEDVRLDALAVEVRQVEGHLRVPVDVDTGLREARAAKQILRGNSRSFVRNWKAKLLSSGAVSLM